MQPLPPQLETQMLSATAHEQQAWRGEKQLGLKKYCHQYLTFQKAFMQNKVSPDKNCFLDRVSVLLRTFQVQLIWLIYD